MFITCASIVSIDFQLHNLEVETNLQAGQEPPVLLYDMEVLYTSLQNCTGDAARARANLTHMAALQPARIPHDLVIEGHVQYKVLGQLLGSSEFVHTYYLLDSWQGRKSCHG